MSLDAVPTPAVPAVPAAGTAPADPTAPTTPTTPTAPRAARLPVGTLAVLAVAVTLADTFLLVSLQGAVGALARAQGPFALWLRLSVALLPLHAAVLVGALVLARRRFGPQLHRPRAVVPAVLVLALAASLVGIGAIAANAAWDYRIQVAQIEDTARKHAHGAGGALAGVPGGNDATCGPACHARRATLRAHGKGIALAAPVVGATNLALVAWVVAMAGGTLEASRRCQRPV